jgi:hypothetical protein
MKTRSGQKVLNVCYIEVNDTNLEVLGDYCFSGKKNSVFDIGIIFAANIDYNPLTKATTLFLNDQVRANLNNKRVIQALRKKGMKVLLSVLGNHKGAGVCNFPDQSSADNFAQQLFDAVHDYGLDGIDFDDEYADYGGNDTGLPNDFSFVYLLSALRTLLGPYKLITFYHFGEAVNHLSFNGLFAGSLIDYSWNAMYGTFTIPNIPGLTDKMRLSPAAVSFGQTDVSTAVNLAAQTMRDEFGVFLWYNLPDKDSSGYISAVTQELCGQRVTYKSVDRKSTIVASEKIKVLPAVVVKAKQKKKTTVEKSVRSVKQNTQIKSNRRVC